MKHRAHISIVLPNVDEKKQNVFNTYLKEAHWEKVQHPSTEWEKEFDDDLITTIPEDELIEDLIKAIINSHVQIVEYIIQVDNGPVQRGNLN